MPRFFRGGAVSVPPQRDTPIRIQIDADPDFSAALAATDHDPARLLAVLYSVIRAVMGPTALLSLADLPEGAAELVSTALSSSLTLTLRALHMGTTIPVVSVSPGLRLIHITLALRDSDIAIATRVAGSMPRYLN